MNKGNRTENIIFSEHSLLQMRLRGAMKSEVRNAIRNGEWKSVKRGRFSTKWKFDFNKPSPITGKEYKFKDVEVIFAEESDRIVIITVKVYYSNK